MTCAGPLHARAGTQHGMQWNTQRLLCTAARHAGLRLRPALLRQGPELSRCMACSAPVHDMPCSSELSTGGRDGALVSRRRPVDREQVCLRSHLGVFSSLPRESFERHRFATRLTVTLPSAPLLVPEAQRARGAPPKAIRGQEAVFEKKSV
jgi:hypothetical protein